MFENLIFPYYAPSRIAFGCEPLGGVDWGNYDISEVKKAISKSIDFGITTFDTADVYGLGASERELGITLGNDRHKAFIITKFGIRWERNSKSQRSNTFKDLEPIYMKTALENSLKRLRIEAIPMYLVHWPDNKTPINEVMECLEDLKVSGKILNYGISNFDLNSVNLISSNWPISCIQDSFNLIDYQNKIEIFKTARKRNLSTFAYGPLAQGLLTNKYSKDSIFPINDRRSRLANFKDKNWLRNTKIINMINSVSKKYSKTNSSTALRWVLDSGYVDCAIVGIKSINQLKENVRCLDWKLSVQDINLLTNL